MTEITVKIKKVGTSVSTPAYKTVGATGCDVCSRENATIPPNSSRLVRTGLFLEVPQGYECQVRPRSGLALNNGITVLNAPGTIDSDYRGEVGVLLYNTGTEPFNVRPGDRIAQFVFAPVTIATFEEADDLADTIRGSGGYGSTGVK